MRIKAGASIEGLHPAFLEHVFPAGEKVFARFGAELVVTSGMELMAPHEPRSLHYEGRAVDLRIKHVVREHWEVLRDVLEAELPEAFHVKLEVRTGTAPHLHVSLPIVAEMPAPPTKTKTKKKAVGD